MGGEGDFGDGERQDAHGSSRLPPPPTADERELVGDGRILGGDEHQVGGDGMLRRQGGRRLGGGLPAEDEQNSCAAPQDSKRRKTGIQLLSARRAAAEDLYVKATCSGSMAKVCDLFAHFDAEKVALVEEIGFGGMLNIPRNTEPDPRVSLWLMRSVETSDRPGLCLHTRNVCGMICRDVDVHFILGVPFEGPEIGLGEPVQDKIVRVVRKLLQISACSFPISMAEVKGVLLKNYGSRMSYAQQTSFKIAAVLYAVTSFLAPSCCNPQFANTEVFKHVLDPSNIKNVNWAGYIIKCIKREAARLKDAMCDGQSSVIINACPAVLKVFYLDNLAFGSLSPLHDVFPRMSAYTSEKMCLLVAADTKKDYMSSLDMYGITEVREKSDVCYSRGFAARSVHRGAMGQRPDVKIVNHTDGSDIASEMHDITHYGLKLIDDHAIEFSELLKGFAGAKALIDKTFDNMRSQWISYSVEKQEARLREVNMFIGESASSGGVGTGKKMGSLKVEAGKLVLEHIDKGESSLSGQSGQGASVGFFNTGNESGQHSVLTPGEKAFYATPADPFVSDGPPVYDATPLSGNTWHASAGLFAAGAGVDSDVDFDEPEVPPDYDVIVLTSHSQFGTSPFLLGLFHSKACPSLCRYIMKMVEKTDAVEAGRIWFRHNQPRELAISGSELRSAFYKEGRYSVVVVDGLTRSYTIYDLLMYKANGVLENIWRHWMPASFAAAVIDGEDFLSPRFRDMFVGDHLGYNVAHCRMLIMTLPKNGRWCSYVWDFLVKVITVLDPYLQQTDVGRLQWEHDCTMDCLHQALFDCKDAWIQGWEVDRHNWTYNHPIALGRRCRDYNTGVYTMHYALHFDGDDVTDLSVEADHALVRADQFYKLMTMPGNSGDAPAFLPKSVG